MRRLISDLVHDIVCFKCYGCGQRTVAGYSADGEPRIIHASPPCDAFMKDEPLDCYLRKCREQN